MDKLLELRQKRAANLKRMRELVDAASKEARSLNDAETKEYEQLRDGAKALADTIVREEELRDLEIGLPGQPAPQRSQKEIEEPGIRMARFIKSALLASRSQTESIQDVAARMYPQDEALRAMTEGVQADGGYAVPVNLYNEIIPLLRQVSITRSLGITELPLPNGNMNIPKQTGAANFKWVGENKPIANGEPKLGNIKLSAKKLAGIIPISNELLADGSIAADRFVRDEIVNGIAEAEDITALYGKGTDNAPKGIVEACVANKITVEEEGGELNADLIYEMVGKLLSVKLNNPALAWRIPGVLWAKLYGMQTATGNYIFRSEMKDGLLCGYPFKIDNNITTTEEGKTQIFLGDWKQFMIGVASALEISVSQDASYTVGSAAVSAFENDLTLMRGILREDFGVRYEEAFVYADNVPFKEAAPVI